MIASCESREQCCSWNTDIDTGKIQSNSTTAKPLLATPTSPWNYLQPLVTTGLFPISVVFVISKTLHGWNHTAQRLTSKTGLFFSAWCSLDPQEVSNVLTVCSFWSLIQMDAPHSFPLTCWSTCGLLTHLDYCEKIFMHRYCVNLSPYFSGIIAPENKCQVIY